MVDSMASLTTAEVSAARGQLTRMLAHPLFSQSERLGRFLKYVVEESLTGGSRRLNQFVIGIEVFDRDESFDPAIDSIVRVEAGRLRGKLLEYYNDGGSQDPVVIDLPKGRYAAVVRSRGLATPPNPASAPDALSEPTLVVLPFDNLSGDPQQDYFSDGLVEDLITALSKLPGLSVISRRSAFTFKGKSATVRQVCDELAANVVLIGSVRRSDTQVRIAAQLVDGVSGKQRWAERYDRQLLDIFAIQDEVVQEIAAALKMTFAQREPTRSTHSLEAYDCVMRGEELCRSFAREDLLQARALFRRAMKLDGAYAQAYASLAFVLVYEWIVGFDVDREDTLTDALALTRRAVELDGALAAAHSLLGWTLLWMNEFDEAVAAGEKAIALDPNNDFALNWLAMCRAWAGSSGEAAVLIDRAMQVNPVEPYYFARGLIQFVQYRLDCALDMFEKCVRRDPAFVPGHLYLASCYSLAGRVAAGREQIAELRRISPGYRMARLGQKRLRDPDLAERFVASLKRVGLS